MDHTHLYEPMQITIGTMMNNENFTKQLTIEWENKYQLQWLCHVPYLDCITIVSQKLHEDN